MSHDEYGNDIYLHYMKWDDDDDDDVDDDNQDTYSYDGDDNDGNGADDNYMASKGS